MELTECPKENQVVNYLDEKISKQNDDNWLKYGKIEFKNFSAKYRENTYIVFKNLNIWINPGEKIGILGWACSGKSTITICLFRLLEVYERTIYIDLDINSIPLEKLRKKITIIPQEKFLFEEDIRFNIDPFNYYKDRIIIDTLKKVKFDYFINKSPLELYQIIVEEDSNLSVEEKD